MDIGKETELKTEVPVSHFPSYKEQLRTRKGSHNEVHTSPCPRSSRTYVGGGLEEWDV